MSYTAEKIQTLDAISHIRLRPGMYIGGVSSEAVLHLLNEVIDNAVDEFNEGRGDKISIYIDQSHSDDIISVRDYGNGIPVGISDDGKNTLTKVFTTLFTGGKFDDTYQSDVSGMNGVGVKAVNALSSSLKVDSYYNGHKYHQEFKRGQEVTEVIDKGETSESGTLVTFIPDSQIFKDHKLPIDDAIQRCKYLASIKPGFNIYLKIKDLKSQISNYTFSDSEELSSILQEGRNRDEDPLVSFSYFTPSTRVRFEYLPRASSSIKSFCNTIYTRDGGYHEDAIISAISNSLKKLTGKNISKSSIFQGLNLVISVYKKNPIYRGQNKTRIADEDIKKTVYDEMYQPIYDALSKEKKFLKYITEISQAQERAIEESALKAVSSDIKTKANKNRLPSKLFFVQNCPPEKRELILTEGDSAGGSVAKARLTSFQEVLPLRGKCLNLIKAGMTRALGNQEVNDIFLSVGGMEGTNTKLRTYNVFILSDSDADGCLGGDTLIPLLDGTEVPIKDLVGRNEFWVYSCKPDGSIVKGLGHDARITKTVDKLYRITLNNGNIIECTDNHPFMLSNGSYKRADHLSLEDHLMKVDKRVFSLENTSSNEVTIHVNDDFIQIANIEILNLDSPIDVYDISVDRYHNFGTSAGVFVHNSHIFTLIEAMFITAFPSFIKNHNLYVIKTPLFCATDGKRRSYGQTAKQAGARFKKEFKSDKFYIQRNKGIGEMSPTDLRYFIDPKTRTVEKVTLGNNSKEEMKKLMGDDSTYRRMIMNEIDEEMYSNSLINGTDVEESEGE